MTNAITALILFVGILGAIGLFYRKLGKLSFWKLAGKLPEQALEHASSDPAWVIVVGSEPVPDEGFVGPFLLSVPSLGRTVKLYAHRDQIESSQQRFIDRYRDILPRHEFPYLSLLALLYPVAAILWMSNTPAPPMLVLGYGFANLGYLLGAAFLFPGHFRILGLDDRFPTLVAGVLFWVVGFALSTVAA
jgi:hypothetical protein